MKIIILLFLVAIMRASDLFQILELTEQASEHDIKKAFRKLSVQYHPDKNPGNKEAHQKYLDVNRAHEILLDPEQRQIYDLYGEEGLQDMRSGQRNRQKGPNAQSDIQVTLEELYNGAEKSFTMQKKVICKTCKGSGSKDGKLKVCKHCNGQGVRMQNVNMGIGFTVQMQVGCDRCGGKGKTSSGNCPTCYGQRVLPQSKTLMVEVEKGMRDGQNILFRGESEQSPDYLPGDVVFTLRQERHPVFTRDGDNLKIDIRITLKESILGFKKQIRHLDNHYVEITNSGITQPFQIKSIKEEGMPIHTIPSQRGDLFVRFILDLPKKLSPIEIQLLEQIFSAN